MKQSILQKRKSKRGSVVAYASMTSLMDMFTIILMFLLSTFSADTANISSSDKFTLPESTATTPYVHRLGIQVTTDEILVEGVVVTTVGEALASTELLIKPLHKALEDEAKKSIFIAESNSEMELSREVVIQGEKSIPFKLVEKIMFTSGQIGYSNISLAVMSVADEN